MSDDVNVRSVAQPDGNEDTTPQAPVQQSGNDYEAYLRQRGLDPADLPSVVETIRAQDEQLRDADERLNSMESTLNDVISSQQTQVNQNPYPQSTSDPWEDFHSAPDPVEAIISKLEPRIESRINQTTVARSLKDAFDSKREELRKETGTDELFNSLQPIAGQLLQSNKGKYAPYGSNAHTLVNKVFADARETATKSMQALLSLGGVNVNANKNTKAAQNSNALNAMGVNNVSPPPNKSQKVDERAVREDYSKAFEKKDVDRMLTLKRKYPFLSGVSHYDALYGG
jgi:hypothetical protein